jgi:hypothetical protein
MKEIILTRGFSTQVDDEDFEWLNQWKWYADSNTYATRVVWDNITCSHRIYMSREIMKPPSGLWVDHIDRNPLNNQRSNLRICTEVENHRNYTLLITNTSGYKGVSFHKRKNLWISHIGVNNKLIHLGYFNISEEAGHAYDRAAVKYYGEFAYLNFPEEWINRDKEYDN